MPSCWNEAPTEVLEAIGGFISERGDLSNPRLACKSWAASLPVGAKRVTDASVRGAGPAGWGSRLLSHVTRLTWCSPPSDPCVFSDAPMARLRHIRIVDSRGLAGLFGSVAPRLESLDLGSTTQPRGIASFAESSPLLASLDIPSWDVTDLREVASVSSLTSLNVFRELARMPRLAVLDLSDTNITDAGVLALARLTSLNLACTRITDACGESLGAGITSLDLSQNYDNIGPFLSLTRLTSLATLRLSDTSVTDDVAAGLPASLTSLDISETYITDGCFAEMAHLTLLETLDVSHCDIIFTSEVDLPRLSKLKATSCIIRRSGAAFAGMPRLTSLDISGGSVDKRGKAALLAKTGLVELNITRTFGWSRREIESLRASVERLLV